MTGFVRTVLIVAFSFFLLPLFCPMKAQKINIGLKGGLNLATLTGYDEWVVTDPEGNDLRCKTEYTTAYHIGAIFRYDFDREFFLQAELLFSRQGRKDSYPDINHSTSLSLNYLKLPVYWGYKYNVGHNLDLLFGVGPYLAYGVSSTDDLFGVVFKRFDIGAAAMGGIQWENLQITLGADFGLNKLLKSSPTPETKIPSVRNQNFNLSIACFF
ncbi:MAG: PorT family protein [Bacteroidales bacterium]|nr:PorT family protein [Bacteroidales bacterium]